MLCATVHERGKNEIIFKPKSCNYSHCGWKNFAISSLAHCVLATLYHGARSGRERNSKLARASLVSLLARRGRVNSRVIELHARLTDIASNGQINASRRRVASVRPPFRPGYVRVLRAMYNCFELTLLFREFFFRRHSRPACCNFIAS